MKQEKDSRISATCASRSTAGYSLVEMAIAILIVGLLFAPAADVYSTYTEYQKRDTTRTNITNIISAIASYRDANGSFPCPSGLNVPRTDPAYGKAFDCTSGGALATIPAVGACDTAKGICIEQTKRNDATTASWNLYQKRVIVGAVPFRQMQVPESKTYDGYGNRLVYVLTQSMADITKLSTLNGAISIEDPSGKSLISPKDSAVFAIISPGKDGVGGWTFDGAEHQACDGAVGADVANCNPGFESKAPNLNAVVVDAYASTAVGAAHYDDFVNYFQSKPDPLWRYIAGTTNIVDLTDKSVGVGDKLPAAPPQPIELHVSKAVVAPNLWNTATGAADLNTNTDALLVYGIDANGNAGKMQADMICDANGANCFYPNTIGGTTPPADVGNFQPNDPGMGCPSGQVMAGIDASTLTKRQNTGGADCYPVAMTCGPDPITGETQFVTGVSNGVPTCAKLQIPCVAATEPAPSPAADGTTCPTISVLAGTDGSSQNFAAPGWDANGCRSVTYTCTKGVWNKTSDNGGFCQLAAVTHPACDCTVVYNSNYTGTCVYTTAEDCTGAYSTTVTSDSCVCKANTQETQNCPSPWTGGTMKRTTTYSGKNCNGSTGNWNTSSCQCNLAKTTTTSGTCPTGYNTGSTTITGTLDKNTCTYSYSTSLAGCGCAAPNPSTRDIAVSCPPPAAGAGIQHQVFNSALGVCAWQDSGGITGCTCPANTTDVQACPSPWASGNESRTKTYGSAPACNITYGAWDTSGCACPTNYTETQACPSPANGNETRTHTFGAGPTCTETISSWNTSACSCPANSIQTASCPAPYTGGTMSRNITYAAPPACTQTIGSWDYANCQCSLPATTTQTLGCGTGYNAGSIIQTATLITSSCTYGPWVTTSNTCACTTPSPSTQTISCGSCTSPWSGTQKCDETFVNNPGVTCDWGSPGAPYGCTCDTTPQPYSAPHDCSGLGLDCYYANPSDPDTGTIANVSGPGTCTLGSPNITHNGTCSSLGFTLQDPQTDGTTTPTKGSSPRYYLTGGCTCAEHRAWVLDNNATVTCYSPSSGDMKIYNCSCR